ncbi:MAG TPA: VIT domain-containing protein [Vicinamibacteria bacterium]
MKSSKRLLALCLLAPSWLGPRTASAQEAARTDRQTLSPYFVVEGADPSLDQLPLKDTRVELTVVGVIADVTVRQVYENRGPRPIHARYVFPASTRAAVYAMSMIIRDKRIVARVEEREQGKQHFEQAKREGKSASLLEQSRPNVFSMSVANIMPGDTISVELSYTELLVPTAGTYEFVYPTVVGPRYSSKGKAEASDADRFVESPYTHQGEPPRSELHLSAQLSTGVPVREFNCPSHQVVPKWDGPARLRLELADSERFSGNRDFVLRFRLSGEEVSSGLLLYQGPDENLFLLVAQPPDRVRVEEIPPREYIFVLDVSGSMHGFPLDTAKKLLADLTRVLRPTDTFNIVLFADGSRTLAERSLPASPQNLQHALRFIGPQSGGGGTELRAAMARAFAIPRLEGVSRSIVLITDGYIEAEKDVFDYVRDHLDRGNVFCFGIGSSVNRYLLEGVARAGQGEPFVVTKPDEAEAAAGAFREYIQSPVLTGIEVSFSGFDVYDVEPAKVPDLFARRPVVVFGKWRGRPQGTIELRGRTGLDPYRASFSPSEAPPREDHRALRYLWARTRIANLSDFGGRGDEAARTAVTQLGLTYNLLTQYTSFIAVEELIRNAGGEGRDVDQPLPLPVGVSDLAVGGAVTGGDEPELAYLGLVLVLMLVGSRVLRARRDGTEAS